MSSELDNRPSSAHHPLLISIDWQDLLTGDQKDNGHEISPRGGRAEPPAPSGLVPVPRFTKMDLRKVEEVDRMAMT
jgi:hypothetical protein